MSRLKTSIIHIKKLPSSFWFVIGATVINQLGSMALVMLVPYLSLYLKLNLPQASFSYAICAFFMLISGIFGGGLADRFGSRRVMIISLLLNGIVLLFFPLARHFWQIHLLCMFWGFFSGLYRPASQTFVSSVSPVGSYKLTFSIYRLAINLGMSIGPAVGGYLAMHSFSAIFIANGAVNVIGSGILLVGLLHSQIIKETHRESTGEYSSGVKFLKSDFTLRLIILGMIPITMVFYQHSSTLSIFLSRNLHLPLSFYGILFTINTLMIVFFELPINIATSHWSGRRCLIVGSIFMTIGFGGFLFASMAWEVMFLTIVWTIGEMVLMPSATSYIAEIAPETGRGGYMSLYSTSVNLGMFIGPWAGGLIMQHFTASGLWIFCIMLGIISILTFAQIRKI